MRRFNMRRFNMRRFNMRGFNMRMMRQRGMIMSGPVFFNQMNSNVVVTMTGMQTVITIGGRKLESRGINKNNGRKLRKVASKTSRNSFVKKFVPSSGEQQELMEVDSSREQ
mmetsp:Transcript_33651/g.79367  ORF Transcript_33651/g.79367 Transcript_33651/m.79367 type:complete len:111 (-) Transcript_33651:377-709(-)